MTTRQLSVQGALWRAVRDHYVDAAFRGRDWKAIGSRYQALIRRGLSDHDFYAAMKAMVGELGDAHSYYQSPFEVREEETRLARGVDVVGVGAWLQPIAGEDHVVVIVVFPGSPAATVGLRPHDAIVRVDRGPVLDRARRPRTLGPEGSRVTLTVQRPGGPARDITLRRRRVVGHVPIDACRISSLRIGYILIPTFLERTIPDQLRDALRRLTAEEPLEGLILDHRVNSGGLGNVATAVMGLFARGLQGHWASRTGREPLRLRSEDVGGSQTVPLAVLVDAETASFAEIASGVLRLARRARVGGGPTAGNVERLKAFSFEDGSRAWIATEVFQPLGQTAGAWEGVGIRPDFLVPTRSDRFTEETDPALGRAVEVLRRR